jgi:spermidine synthase
MRMCRWIVLLVLLVASSAQAKPIFETKSRFSRIVVEEKDNVRSLLFDGVTQSSVRTGDPKFLVHDYTQTSMIGLALTDAHRVLVIGLGGGSMPMFIRAYDDKAVIDVVEIDPTVLEIATRYFGFREDPALKVYVEDGAELVQRVQQQYDLIILDAYAPDFIPPQMATAEFFKTVKDKLRPNGALVSNVWGPPNPAYEPMLKTQRSVFKQVSVVKARNSGNHIFVALERNLAEIVERGFVK